MSETRLPDRLTIAATAVVAYTIASLLHEGAGHGGVCLFVGGHVTDLTSTYLGCDGGMSRWAERAVQAAGTLMNLACGLVALGALSRLASRKASAYFLWLFAAVNLLQGGGYLLVSPLGHFGDWDAFVKDLPAQWPWRIGLTLLGLALSLLAARALGRVLASFLGDDAARKARLDRLVWVSYLCGCAIDVAASTLNPIGWQMIIGSSVAAAFGGTCWLVFVVPPFAQKRPAVATVIDSVRSWRWVAAGVACAGVNFFFGRGLHWGS